jgi:hypothetical protein
MPIAGRGKNASHAMIANLIVLLCGALVLWLWCRRDRRRTRIREEQAASKTAATWRQLGTDVDQLIELEIAGLPPEEQARVRAQLAARRR